MDANEQAQTCSDATNDPDTLEISGIKLDVHWPKADQIIEGNQPPVWTEPIKARLLNFKNGKVNFYWDMKVIWQGLSIHTPIVDNIYQNDDPPKIGTNSNWVDLGIKVEKPLLGGDQVMLHVRAVTDDGHIYETNPTWQKVFQIKGRNPSKPSILAQLGDLKYKVIAYQESKFNQFHVYGNPSREANRSPYFPFQGGDPYDIGIMQIHNPRSDAIIWDWTVNITTGQNILSDDISYIRNYYSTMNTKFKDAIPLTVDQMLKAAFCRYNWGNRWQNYWHWIPPNINTGEDGYWDENPPPPAVNHEKSYPEEAWDLYVSPPSDWQ
jgi:hypothetical protein